MVDANATYLEYGVKYLAVVGCAVGEYAVHNLKPGDVVLCVNHHRTPRPLSDVTDMDVSYFNTEGELVTFKHDDSNYQRAKDLFLTYIGRPGHFVREEHRLKAAVYEN